MSTEQKDQNRNDQERDAPTSQSQINNGNIGREAGEERKGEGSFAELSDIVKDNKPVNEEGVAENEENHWTGNHGQRSSNRPASKDSESYSDKNLGDAVQQNEGRNHVTNAGGTSEEDLRKGKLGLEDREDRK